MRNVAQLTTLPSEQRRRRLAWTAAQARRFLEAARGDAAHPVFVLALVYGLRRRISRVSVVATNRSTNSGGNALVNAPTDTRSGNHPSG
jgi:hypothetical protein